MEQQPSRSLRRRKSRDFLFFARLSDHSGGKGSSSKAVSLSAGICLGRDSCTWQGSLPAGGGRVWGLRVRVSPGSEHTHILTSIHGLCALVWVPCVCPSVHVSHLFVTVCMWVGTEQVCPGQGTKGRGSAPGLRLSFPGDAGPCRPVPPCGIQGWVQQGWRREEHDAEAVDGLLTEKKESLERRNQMRGLV